MNYQEYLEQNNYSRTTIAHYVERLDEFQKWLKSRRIKSTEIDYKTNLGYIKHLKQKGLQVQTINNHIVTLRNYFDYLIEINERAENPLDEVSVKGTIKKVLHNLLSLMNWKIYTTLTKPKTLVNTRGRNQINSKTEQSYYGTDRLSGIEHYQPQKPVIGTP